MRWWGHISAFPWRLRGRPWINSATPSLQAVGAIREWDYSVRDASPVPLNGVANALAHKCSLGNLIMPGHDLVGGCFSATSTLREAWAPGEWAALVTSTDACCDAAEDS